MVADWTPARHSRDIEENIEDTIEAVMKGSTSRSQCINSWRILIQHHWEEECKQATARKELMLAEGFQKLNHKLEQRYYQENPDHCTRADLPPQDAYWPHTPLLGPDHVLIGVGNINYGVLPSGYGQTPNFDSSIFAEVPPDTSGSSIAPVLSSWSCPPLVNLQEFTAHGPQYPEPGMEGTDQPGHYFMPSNQWPRSYVVGHHSSDSGSFGSEFSNNQGGTYQ